MNLFTVCFFGSLKEFDYFCNAEKRITESMFREPLSDCVSVSEKIEFET